jgi:hypothetical protein
MQMGEVVFQYLDASQLLKHALGLATHLGERFSLHYFYYDWPGAESQQHQAEIRAFADLVDAGLAFTAASYQELFARLQDGSTGEHATYLDYLHQRYFGTDD